MITIKSSSSSWEAGTCDDQCDLSSCPEVEAPKTLDGGCKHVQCSPEWCCGGQTCPSDVPYQCLSGSARYGCHVDPFQWEYKVADTACSKCCDATTCGERDADKCDALMKTNTKTEAATVETPTTKSANTKEAASAAASFRAPLVWTSLALVMMAMFWN